MSIFLSSLLVLVMTVLILYLPAFIFYIFYQAFNLKNIIYIYIVRFILGYLLVSIFGIVLYYLFSDLTLQSSTTTRTDIIYIFTACAALCAPILVITTLNLWREQYRTTLNKEVIINLVKEIEELRQVLLETYELMQSINSSHQRSLAILQLEKNKPNNEDRINKVIEDIKSGYYLQIKNLLEKNTFKIFEKKCSILKYSTILRMGNDVLKDEPEEIEKVTIRVSEIIHAVHSRGINENQSISEQDIEDHRRCIIDLQEIVEKKVYPKLKNELYLK